MNAAIFRKVSLERLSSPERLDQAARATSARAWLALLGVLVILGAGVAWSFNGSLATKVAAEGIIVRREGVVNVVATGTGLIVKLKVRTGDTVAANQVIAEIAQPAAMEKIRIGQSALDDLKRERERQLRVRTDSAQLQLDALARQNVNAETEIANLRDQIKIVDEQIPVDDQLLARGLITRQQSLATRQKRVTLEGQISSLQAQMKQFEAQEYNTRNQPAEGDVEMQGRVADMERNIAGLRKDLSTTSEIVSPYAGQVLELKVYRGSAVVEGTPVVSIQPESGNLEALVYLSAMQAKDVKPGMEVQISPGTVRREEYGYMIGRVSFVAAYPSTPAAMMSVLGNESLVQSVSRGGPVTEVRAELDPDQNESGFRWSSRKGPELRISSGTLCAAQIVTRHDRPISLALPGVKQRLGMN